jgi:hypothetical protein
MIILKLEKPQENVIKTCRTVILHFVYADVKRGLLHWGVEHKLRVFENRVLRKIIGPKRDNVTGEWRRLQNEQLHDLYLSPDIVGVMKSRSMRLLGRVTLKGKRRYAYRVLVGKPERKGTWGDLGVDGKIMKLIFNNLDG